MSIGENIIEGMQKRAKTELHDYELFSELYATDREAFELERKRHINLFINSENCKDRKKLLQKTQLQWEAIFNGNT